MSRSPTLIAVGDNCLDVYLSKDRMAVGGNALNVAVQWMRAGLKTRYFGLVGPDPEGDVVRTALCRAGLDPDDCEVRPGSTAVTLLLERDGDRRFLLEDLGVGLGYVPEGARYAALRAADWVHLAPTAHPNWCAPSSATARAFRSMSRRITISSISRACRSSSPRGPRIRPSGSSRCSPASASAARRPPS